MKIVAHRGAWSNRHSENSLPSLLGALERGWSVETDIRIHENRIVLSHDPVARGETPPSLDELIARAPRNSAQLFLNVKEDGMLPLLLDRPAWREHDVIFFDMSTPELVRYSRVLEPRHLATRWSDVELEPVLYSHCDWLWIDCFDSEVSFDVESSRRFLFEKKLVFVSPQLHGRAPERLLARLAQLETSLRHEVSFCQDVGPSAIYPPLAEAST